MVAFAGLERFRDAKLKSLSSGMMVRLAFSTALRADADTLLLDEVLAVGDAQFQRKCIEVFHGLKRQRKTIVLVSHDLASVQRFCEHVYWLDKGRLVMAGEANEVVQTYLAVSAGGADLDAPALESDEETEHRWGDGKLRFTDVDAHRRARAVPVIQVTPWTRLVLRAIAHRHRRGREPGVRDHGLARRPAGLLRPTPACSGWRRAGSRPATGGGSTSASPPRSSTGATR